MTVARQRSGPARRTGAGADSKAEAVVELMFEVV